MATTIRVKIANGYRSQVDAIAEATPGITPDEAAQRWVGDRYGGWITANIGEHHSFLRVTLQEFDVRFDRRADALAFQAAIGGQEVVDAS